MANTKNTSENVPQSTTNNGDFHILPMVFEKLSSHNCISWSQSMKLTLRGKGKLGHLDGSKKQPKESTYAVKWEEENALVTAWLIQTMHPSIGKNYPFMENAQDVWEAVKEAYSKIGNDGQMYEIENRIRDTKQGAFNDVNSYYSTLRGLWLELDYYQSIGLGATKIPPVVTKILEKGKTFKFLAGLKPEFDVVCSLAIGKTPFPTLSKAFSMVRSEESRRKVMARQESAETAMAAKVDGRRGEGKRKGSQSGSLVYPLQEVLP